MIRTLLFLLFFWLHQLSIAPILLVLGLQARFGDLRAARRRAAPVAVSWSRFLVRAAGARVTTHGKVDVPEDQAVLFVSNHQGAFDIPLAVIAAGRPVAFIAKEIRRVPLLGAWNVLVGTVFVDRGNRHMARESADDVIARLREGLSMVVFPEGPQRQ